MAFKIYKSENYFIINDTSTGDDVLRQVRDNVRWEKKDSKYSFFLKSNLLLKNEDQFVKGSKDLKQLPFSNIYGPIDFADTVDSTGTSWASESVLDVFLNKWTGYIHLETIGADASYNVVNSTPTVLASGTIASGASADIPIPDITFTDSNGTVSSVPAGVDIVASAQIKDLFWELNFNGTDDVIFIPATVNNVGTLTSGTGSNVGTITVSTDGVTYGALSFPFTPVAATIYYFKRSTVTVTGSYTMTGTYV